MEQHLCQPTPSSHQGVAAELNQLRDALAKLEEIAAGVGALETELASERQQRGKLSETLRRLDDWLYRLAPAICTDELWYHMFPENGERIDELLGTHRTEAIRLIRQVGVSHRVAHRLALDREAYLSVGF